MWGHVLSRTYCVLQSEIFGIWEMGSLCVLRIGVGDLLRYGRKFDISPTPPCLLFLY